MTPSLKSVGAPENKFLPVSFVNLNKFISYNLTISTIGLMSFMSQSIIVQPGSKLSSSTFSRDCWQ